MPKYDYKCTVCNHMFEISQSFSSEPVSDCPECSSLAKRQFQVVPIVFKGSGFYVNDYGKKGSTSTSSNSDNTNNGSAEIKITKMIILENQIPRLKKKNQFLILSKI